MRAIVWFVSRSFSYKIVRIKYERRFIRHLITGGLTLYGKSNTILKLH